ncbi:MAG: hypothetical protein L7U72_02320 [Rubripirellula sp.]|nr:hypothetical protein [Rubripirellula sp.]
MKTIRSLEVAKARSGSCLRHLSAQVVFLSVMSLSLDAQSTEVVQSPGSTSGINTGGNRFQQVDVGSAPRRLVPTRIAQKPAAKPANLNAVSEVSANPIDGPAALGVAENLNASSSNLQAEASAKAARIAQENSEASPSDRPISPMVGANADALKSVTLVAETEARKRKRAARQFEDVPAVQATGFIFNFQGAPWGDVLNRFAEETGLSLQMGTVPSGSFHFVSTKVFSPEEALNVLNGQLIEAGYILMQRDGFLTVHSLSEEIPPNLIPVIETKDLDAFPSNSLASLRIPIENGDATILAKEIELLISAFGGTDVLSESNTLIITDLASNLRKLDDLLLLSERDVAMRPMTVIKLNHIPADVVSGAVNEFFGEGGGVAGGAGRPAAGPRVVGTGEPIDGYKVICVPEMNTNSLLINAQPRYFEVVKDLIAKLDAPPHQVVIKAMLVEVDLGTTDEFGVELGLQDSILFDRSVIDDIMTITETVTNGNIQTTDQVIISQQGSPGFAFNNQPLGNNIAVNPSRFGTQGLSNFSVGRINNETGFGGLVLSGGSESVSFLLRALAAKRDVSVLSRPQIRTVHNVMGKIQIGQEVPVVDGVNITAVGSANPVIRQSDAGIILEVTPRISPDGTVVVDVKAEKSAYRTGRGSGVPIFTDATSGNVIEAPIKDLTKADGTVAVKDGQTIVLGGMIGNQTVTSESKVPWLGDLPWVGRLFRHDVETVSRKELLIFLTPTILTTDEDAEVHDAHELGLVELPNRTRSEMLRLNSFYNQNAEGNPTAGMIEQDELGRVEVGGTAAQ